MVDSSKNAFALV